MDPGPAGPTPPVHSGRYRCACVDCPARNVHPCAKRGCPGRVPKANMLCRLHDQDDVQPGDLRGDVPVREVFPWR